MDPMDSMDLIDSRCNDDNGVIDVVAGVLLEMVVGFSNLFPIDNISSKHCCFSCFASAAILE